MSTGTEEYSEPVSRIPEGAFGEPDGSGARYAIATIRTLNTAFPQWAAPVRVTVRNRGGVIDVVGIDRKRRGRRRGIDDKRA